MWRLYMDGHAHTALQEVGARRTARTMMFTWANAVIDEPD